MVQFIRHGWFFLNRIHEFQNNIMRVINVIFDVVNVLFFFDRQVVDVLDEFKFL